MFAEVEDFIVDVNNKLIEGTLGAQVSILDTIEMTLGAIRAERALDTLLRANTHKDTAVFETRLALII